MFFIIDKMNDYSSGNVNKFLLLQPNRFFVCFFKKMCSLSTTFCQQLDLSAFFFCFAYDFVWSESSLELFIWMVCIKLLYMTMTLVNSTNVFAHCKTKFQMKIILNGMRPYAAKKKTTTLYVEKWRHNLSNSFKRALENVKCCKVWLIKWF